MMLEKFKLIIKLYRNIKYHLRYPTLSGNCDLGLKVKIDKAKLSWRPIQTKENCVWVENMSPKITWKIME